MNPQAAKEAIKGLERQIKDLKGYLGIEDEKDQEELDEASEPAEPAMKQVGRGRKKKTVPTLGNMDTEMDD